MRPHRGSSQIRFDREIWNTFRRRAFYVAAISTIRALPAPRRRAGNRKCAQYWRQRPVLPFDPTQPVRRYHSRVGVRRPRRRVSAGTDHWRRLIVEKPFGHDLASARQLSDQIHQVFREQDVYRIDHYLGKETVQNILALRFGNGIFEPLWSRQYVNHVQITGAESIGVEGRGKYYQEAGALADMIQNHLLR
jgi:glucose-6-phosphate 1-dehydrogenase